MIAAAVPETGGSGQVGAVYLSDNPDALLYGQRSYRRAVGMDERA